MARGWFNAFERRLASCWKKWLVCLFVFLLLVAVLHPENRMMIMMMTMMPMNEE
jgi:hypothetical protein